MFFGSPQRNYYKPSTKLGFSNSVLLLYLHYMTSTFKAVLLYILAGIVCIAIIAGGLYVYLREKKHRDQAMALLHKTEELVGKLSQAKANVKAEVLKFNEYRNQYLKDKGLGGVLEYSYSKIINGLESIETLFDGDSLREGLGIDEAMSDLINSRRRAIERRLEALDQSIDTLHANGNEISESEYAEFSSNAASLQDELNELNNLIASISGTASGSSSEEINAIQVAIENAGEEVDEAVTFIDIMDPENTPEEVGTTGTSGTSSGTSSGGTTSTGPQTSGDSATNPLVTPEEIIAQEEAVGEAEEEVEEIEEEIENTTGGGTSGGTSGTSGTSGTTGTGGQGGEFPPGNSGGTGTSGDDTPSTYWQPNQPIVPAPGKPVLIQGENQD